MTNSRREFVKIGATAGGGLIISFTAPMAIPYVHGASGNADSYQSLYLEVTGDGSYFLTFDKSDMGQGLVTGQATLFGEEADINPKKFQLRAAPADERYVHEGDMGQLTGGSTSTKSRYKILRQAGATYRHHVMLAAAKTWQVPLAELTTQNAVISHAASGRKSPYHELNNVIATLAAPPSEDLPLKRPEEFRYIGKERPTVDASEKSTGEAPYGIDYELPGMKTAFVLRSPVFGGKLKSFDKNTLKGLPHVVDVKEIPRGLAIVCDTYWQCLQAQAAITDAMVTWEIDDEDLVDSQDQEKRYRASLDQNPPKAGTGETIVSAEYFLPFLAHATMEPQNAVAWKQGDRLKVFAPTQYPSGVHNYAAYRSGLAMEKIEVEVAKYLGGGFGRRSAGDFAAEAIDLALEVDYPVKVMWSREDDMQFSPLRPMNVHRLDAVVFDNKIKSWRHQVAGESIIQKLVGDILPSMLPKWFPKFFSKGIAGAAEGLMDIFGQVPMLSEGTEPEYDFEKDVDVVEHETKIPMHFWRSVGHSHNGFVVESFLDEVLAALGKDPLAGRLELLAKTPRARAVVEKVGELSGWKDHQPTANRALGLAYHYSFSTYCAEVADVEIKDDQYIVHKVWAVVDCGRVINPEVVKAQVRSSVIFGLTAARYGEITFKEGRIQQQNFDSYRLMRLDETPEIEVAWIESSKDPTGIGEPAYPPLAAAVANGIFRASGQRLRRMPFRLDATTA